MSARSRSEALRTYQGRLQQAVSCITDAVLVASDPSGFTSLHTARELRITLNRDLPVPLAGRVPVTFAMFQRVQVEPGDPSRRRSWQVTLAAYSYTYRLPNGPEIVAYQWEPSGKSHITYPHLHIGRGATGNVTTFGPRGLHRIHFPTGPITIEDVLRLAITEFEVEPRRRDWEHILSDS